MTMKRFERREIREALRCAGQGGQALHVFLALKMPAPSCFRRSLQWGHLFDQDAERVEKTARRLGVRKVVVHHRDTPKQHVDLCGKPLERAIRSCEKEG